MNIFNLTPFIGNFILIANKILIKHSTLKVFNLNVAEIIYASQYTLVL